MTQYKPFIFINRLVIAKNDKVVYDNTFHKGVNIIRGDNSSGKSTIMDFLFFALGGNVMEKQWKVVALQCEHTYIEVNINNKIFVLNRQVSLNTKEQMKIFEGTYNDSIHSSPHDWLSFPYASTRNKESFHDNLLNLLDIPITKSQDSSYITFHQILRLIYTDQLSSISRIFREEDFDSSFKRETIGDLIIGVYSKDLTQGKLEIAELEKSLSKIISDLKAFSSMYGEIESEESFAKKIESNKTKVEELIKQLNSVEEIDSDTLDKDTKDLIKAHRSHLDKLINNKNELLEKINTLQFEKIDSESFVQNLKKRLADIKESENTLAILSDITFNFCPACFNKVEILSDNAHSCGLCKSNDVIEYESPTFRLRKNIEFQISETNELIPKFKSELEENISSYNKVKENIRICKNKILILEKPIPGISTKKSQTLMEIGRLEQESLELTQKRNILDKLYQAQNLRNIEQVKLTTLKNDIAAKEQLTIVNRNKRKQLISSIALDLLRKDLDREDGFKNPEEVTFDFANDRVKVDGISNFSASSTAFLKTILKLSILIASCKDSGFLYPRLALIDNVEDKGMEEARSQNLQRIIVEESEKLDVEHQIIFTTSMIDPAFEDTEFCVGEFYDSENRTLNLH